MLFTYSWVTISDAGLFGRGAPDSSGPRRLKAGILDFTFLAKPWHFGRVLAEPAPAIQAREALTFKPCTWQCPPTSRRAYTQEPGVVEE